MQMSKIFLLFFQEYFSFTNGTFAFKNHSWEFQTALLFHNVYYLQWISRCANKSGQMLQAVKQSLTWMPETFDARFPISVNSSWWAVCPHLFSALPKFKCLAAKHSCLNPLWTFFLVTCSRLDPNDGIRDGGCAWMSPEETVVVKKK